MDKKYSIENVNGETYNDEKSCDFLTDSNCLGQNDDKKTRSDMSNSALSKKDEKKSSVNLGGRGTTTSEGKDLAEPEMEDDIPEKNR
nr:hypothetical protein [uncultured Caproiciproducens sp.]